jgi:hypothetical protein
MKETITKPFNTAIPERAIKPMAAEIDKGIPLIHKEKNPLVKAKGIPVKTSSEFFMLSRAANSMRNISKRAMGTTS